ncbi:MAG: hypothetical protein GFH27_549289n76 [Chloroflexi bacterium AL-W]|nr:hypothetical protein [Chloroflexi bacterium AL-N1]NOK66808.1 hypothetical protein [Chloroflexi bacterium AL-N10]NOK74900.1 hypothetical protein [Chloroflexi bacterium AL-N5]NOK81411.1 hypothetical protein [Chloroflexi bacterium AL-W]NOK88880.1 hypothetical protein [Chloroflexi bacterium AL-N15]
MTEEKTVEFNGKKYILTRVGWVDTNTHLRVDVSTSRKLYKAAARAEGSYRNAILNPANLLDQARRDREDKRLFQAEQLVRQVLSLDSNYVGAQALLCGILRDRGLPQAALDATVHARRLSDHALLTSRAAAYCDLRCWDEAVLELKPVLAAGGDSESFRIVWRIKDECPEAYEKPRRSTYPVKENSMLSPNEITSSRNESSELRHVTIYTDGACIDNPGPGGYGVVLISRNHRKELSGGYRKTTNNRMELMAAFIALQSLKYRLKVTLYSDSRYVVDGMSKGWAESWRNKGWMRNKKDKATNVDLWAQILDLAAQHEIEFVWIKGHAGNEENERCDVLSMQAAQEKHLPPDSAYENNQTTGNITPSLFDFIE